ncbi:MAG: outer membrane lipid asymmetry maintenance protein MlaD [Hydrogenophilales bacterium CG03_land_8_20_14_0_80_62_28]|nr:outer membrane lipid asymmetry maintenance protein MlaD [Betaproteobacteria bacterium]OIO78402.1 MAG: outer membrane lipid asymmetry maintenance protein MlaD [Hydrogenophilaceae bacterium CG1_02_62_390]PIV24163.1 MAG: outer membrane lipid asymmetry maintenance protein MlaD [Hydrogenophilales bacterium CG03_land_8_20_14_0_80_62_28]PIW37551.1 MAG: outer membrane lipid asymmetry maintenance protein MlaD [Hydrogenophilales bacterium CG15_BIG_FIL_POST_REV_8_21_14_020_62_31]PIW71148.1 MAG: outer m
MERTTLDLWVGLFVLAGIGALVFLALKVGNVGAFDTNKTYAITANFNNIGGLKVKAPVKSAGVVVGRVAEIRFNTADYEAEVVLNIGSVYKFPKDTSAAIMTSGLLGEQYIALEAGADDKMLAQGDTLKITQGAVVLENLIGQFIYGKSGEAGKSAAPAQ